LDPANKNFDSKKTSRIPSDNLNDKDFSENQSISSEEKYKNESWVHDPLLENMDNKPLRLSSFIEIPIQNANIQKNQIPFWEENNEKNINNVNNVNNNTNGKTPMNNQVKIEVRGSTLSIKKGTPLNTPNNNLLRFAYQKQKSNDTEEMLGKGDFLKVEDDKSDEKFFLNPTPYLKNRSKIIKENEKYSFIIF